MKNKFAYLCILALLTGLLVLAVANLSLSASPPKATGGVSFVTTENGVELRHWAEFEAHAAYDDHPAKGWLNYHDANKLKFRMDVQCVTVVDDWAFFSGPIVSASDTLFLDQWLLVVVHDGGTPGSKGDQIWGEFYDSDPGCQPLYPDPDDMSDVKTGNLVVH